MSHLCHAEGCAKNVPPRMLFCAPHWRLVPPPWKAMVWQEYRKGQEVDKRPSGQYLLVQAIVVAIVARMDRVWSEAQAEDHIHRRAERVWRVIDQEWVARLPIIVL